MPLILPESEIAAVENAEMEQQADAQIREAARWTEELKRIDPHLALVFIGEGADHPDLVAARWHIRRKSPEGHPDDYMPLTGDHGEYREPGGWMLEQLKELDMFNPRVHQSRKEAKEKLREVKQRNKALEKEQRLSEMELAYRASQRVRGDAGMTRSTAAKRRGDGLR